MQKLTTTVIAAAVIATIAGGAGAANASLTPSTPITIDTLSEVSVEFISSDAAAKGSLYFLGWQPSSGPISFAGHSDGNNLGQHLFSNHGTAGGTTIPIGQFDAGTLHFAYLVTNGVDVAPTGSLFRTNIGADKKYFATDIFSDDPVLSITVGVEDIRKPSKSDWDYNDVIFRVHASSPVPAPGVAAVGVMTASMVAGRRRRA